jgi:hypothetical protein
MAFICRKPFTFKGTHYRPGDVVAGFPEGFHRSEGFIRTGFIVEDANRVAPEPKKGRKPKAAPVVEEPTIVEETVVEELPEVVEEVVPTEE